MEGISYNLCPFSLANLGTGKQTPGVCMAAADQLGSALSVTSTYLLGVGLNRPGTDSGGGNPLLGGDKCSGRESPLNTFFRSLPLSGFSTDAAKQGTKPEEGLSLFFGTLE